MTKPDAIVLAGGEGSRFRSQTPKVAHDLLGRPLLAWPLKAVQEAGAASCCIVVSPAIKTLADDLFCGEAGVETALQAKPLGTADAVQCGLTDTVAGTVLVVCADTPLLRGKVLRDAIEAHHQGKAAATVISMRVAQPGAYGRLVRDADGHPLRIVEAAEASEDELTIGEVNSGAWVFETNWLKQALGQVSADNSQGELYLTDLLAQAAAQGKAHAFVAPDDEDFLGVNDREQFARVHEILCRRICTQHRLSGVSILGDNVQIDPEVELSEDVVIYGPATLRGATSVGRGTVLESGCWISDSVLGEDVTVLPHTVIDNARVGNRVQLGPFARLRPEADLRDGSKAGNFVEIKKSIIHEGAKVNHLTYIGDAEIGAAANIGAGTITCNYDGVHKHRTVIGSGVFVGSNTALVAPVEIGEGAVVGAGSTVTRDVPAGALVVERAEEKIVPGYAARKKGS